MQLPGWSLLHASLLIVIRQPCTEKSIRRLQLRLPVSIEHCAPTIPTGHGAPASTIAMPSATSSPALPSRSARTAVASVLRRSLTVMGFARACWTIRTTAARAGFSVRPGTTARLHLSPVSPSAHQSNRVSETDRPPHLLAQRPGSWRMRNYENSGIYRGSRTRHAGDYATGPRMWELVLPRTHPIAAFAVVGNKATMGSDR